MPLDLSAKSKVRPPDVSADVQHAEHELGAFFRAARGRVLERDGVLPAPICGATVAEAKQYAAEELERLGGTPQPVPVVFPKRATPLRRRF